MFATLTYDRSIGIVQAWRQVSLDYNRYIQRIRRLHGCSVDYIRTIEAHKDNFPHLHAVLQFDASLGVTNDKYFDSGIYQKWKGLWGSGVSDYQAPYSGARYPILYIVKYITKSNATKTLWRKLLATTKQDTPVQNVARPTVSGSKPVLVAPSINDDPTPIFCKQFKLKQCTWSRGFKFPAIERTVFPSPPQTSLNTIDFK